MLRYFGDLDDKKCAYKVENFFLVAVIFPFYSEVEK